LYVFSRRRRHTSFSRDWSSDVCSSDLRLRHFWTQKPVNPMQTQDQLNSLKICFIGGGNMARALISGMLKQGFPPVQISVIESDRSEERRVGKESRSRWSRDGCMTTRTD